MSRETQKPSESEPRDGKPSRRDLLTGGILVLGASALLQPDGGVIGSADAAEKAGKGGKKKKGGRKGGKKKEDTPKKDGGKALAAPKKEG
jgi:hypothetical protein